MERETPIIPCILDPNKDCPTTCGLYKIARRTVEKAAIEQGITIAEYVITLRLAYASLAGTPAAKLGLMTATEYDVQRKCANYRGS